MYPSYWHPATTGNWLEFILHSSLMVVLLVVKAVFCRFRLLKMVMSFLLNVSWLRYSRHQTTAESSTTRVEWCRLTSHWCVLSRWIILYLLKSSIVLFTVVCVVLVVCWVSISTVTGISKLKFVTTVTGIVFETRPLGIYPTNPINFGIYRL